MPRPRRVVCLAVSAMALIAIAVPSVAGAASTFQFSRTVAGQPEAGHPQDAAMDASGALLVLDTNADAVVRYAADGSRTALVASLDDPFGIVAHTGGGFDVTDNRVIRRYAADGRLVSATDTVNGRPISPRGIAAAGDSGLIVADAASSHLLKHTGSPQSGFDSGWSVLANDTPGPPADVVVLGSDRVLASFPASGELVMFDASSGAKLGSTSGFGTPEDLLVLGEDVLVADGAGNRIQAFRGLGAAGARSFPAPEVLTMTGKTFSAPGCLFATSASPSGFGVCAGAAGGTAGSVDLYGPPSGAALLAPIRESIEATGADCSGTSTLGNVVAMTCRPTTIRLLQADDDDDDFWSGGALTQLLLGVGGGVAASLYVELDDDLSYLSDPIPWSASAQRRARRRRSLTIEPGEVLRLPLKASPRMRKALRRALRKRRVVRRRIAIRITDRTTGKRYRIKRRIVVRRRRS